MANKKVTMMTLMAKEKSPVGKVVVQQNIVAQKLINIIGIITKLKGVPYDEVKLKKMTLGSLIRLFSNNFKPTNEKEKSLLEILDEYNTGRNKFIHHLNNGILEEANIQDIYKETKQLKKIGNRVISKLNSLERKTTQNTYIF